MKDNNIIRCPHCGAEYMPSEIFYSDDFLESDVHILKDKDGKIQHINCKNAELLETYCCDVCGKSFEVKANIEYTVSEVDDFDDDYSISIEG